VFVISTACSNLHNIRADEPAIPDLTVLHSSFLWEIKSILLLVSCLPATPDHKTQHRRVVFLGTPTKAKKSIK